MQGRHSHLELTMTAEDYLSQTGHAFVPLHNPSIITRKWGSPKTKRSGQNSLGKTKYSSDAAPT